MTLRGSCLCGDVKFRIEGETDRPTSCHCVECRKMSGHYWSSVETTQDSLILEQGEVSLSWYPRNVSEQGFCVICGTPLFWRVLDPDNDKVSVSLGAIDGETGLTVRTHIFTSEKGDYYDLPDGVAAYEKGNS